MSSSSKLVFFIIRATHLHTQTASSFSNPTLNDTVLNALCTSFRQGHSWDTITHDFPYLHLNDTSLQHLLLKLTSPSDAKPALSLFHWSAKRINDINKTNNTFQHSTRSYCITIHLLLKANFLTDARALLQSLTARNIDPSTARTVVDSLIDTCHDTHGVVSTFPSLAVNLLIQTYAKSKLTDIAFDVCRYVYERGYSVSVVTFNALLHAVQRSENCGFVWDVYEYMIRRRCYPNFATLRIMIDAMCKQGELEKVVDTLDRIMNKRSFRNPCVVVNCGLMLRILNNRGDDASELERDVVVLLKRLLQKNLLHEDVVYSMIVHARVVFGDLDSAWGLYKEMVSRGFGENAFVYNSLIGAFCRCGRVEEGIGLLREMEGKGLKPYGETYEHVVLAADSEHLEVCVSVFEEMVRVGFVPGCLVFNKVVERLCEKGEVVKANEMLTVLLDRGFLPDDVTYFQLMQGYARKEEVQEVLKLYYEMEYRGVSPGLSVFVTVIQCLCRCGKVEDAEKYLRIMKARLVAPGVSVYEALIGAYVKKGDSARAICRCDEMPSLELYS